MKSSIVTGMAASILWVCLFTGAEAQIRGGGGSGGGGGGLPSGGGGSQGGGGSGGKLGPGTGPSGPPIVQPGGGACSAGAACGPGTGGPSGNPPSGVPGGGGAGSPVAGAGGSSTTSTGGGGRFYVKNECADAVRLALSYKVSDTEWPTRYWWRVEAGKGSILKHNGEYLRSRSGSIYLYAEGGGKFWQADPADSSAVSETVDGKQIRWRYVTLAPDSDSDWTLRLTC